MNLIPFLLSLVFAPLMLGIINRVKSLFGGRTGPPLLQPYYDLLKLLRKGAVYSHTTTWVFRAGPVVTLAALLVAATLLPFGNYAAAVSFSGDLVVFVYLLGLTRFITVVAALDTGSPFEGMGASREVFFATLAEPALLLGLAAIAKEVVGQPFVVSLTDIHLSVTSQLWTNAGLVLIFVAMALFIVFLAETSRIPVDDPNTHLELTMIHEVMVLDHGGPDLAYIEYASALKLWLLGMLLIGIIVPVTGIPIFDLVSGLVCMALLAVSVGIVESTRARLKFLQVPQLLIGAVTLVVLALVVGYR